MGDINQLETWGNVDTMNMNPIIYQNILDSRYFQSLYEKIDYHDVINEIYDQVTNVAPFVTGTTPSTAFCCLYKLWTMRLSVKQLEHMVDHKDSPYIRAVGFLYLRYVCAPAQLWDWLGYYLDEEQEINVASGTKPQMKTIGELCRMLLTEQKFYGTMLPRIPVPIARELEKKLGDYDREKIKDIKGTEDQHRKKDRSPSRSSRYSRSPTRSSRYSRSPSPRRHRRSPSRHRHSSRKRDDKSDLDDYEKRSRRHHSRRRNERDELDDYERKRRQRRSRSRESSRRSRYSDDSDDDRRRRRQRRSPSVTRDRPSEYRS